MTTASLFWPFSVFSRISLSYSFVRVTAPVAAFLVLPKISVIGEYKAVKTTIIIMHFQSKCFQIEVEVVKQGSSCESLPKRDSST